MIIDGTGNPAFRADMGLKQGKIITLGHITKEFEPIQEINARGLVIAPGFIDMHSHSDMSI